MLNTGLKITSVAIIWICIYRKIYQWGSVVFNSYICSWEPEYGLNRRILLGFQTSNDIQCRRTSLFFLEFQRYGKKQRIQLKVSEILSQSFSIKTWIT